MLWKKIKKNWPYIRKFRLDSLFWRSFLIVSILLIVPFVSLSVVFYSKQFGSMLNEIMNENNVLLSSAKDIVDDSLIECDSMSSYIATAESTQLYTINGTVTDSFSVMAELTRSLPVIYHYIDSVYIYSEKFNSIHTSGSIIPLSQLNDNSWLSSYDEISNQRGITVMRTKNGTYPALISIIKPIYVSDEKMGAVVMNINSQSLYHSIFARYSTGSQRLFLVDTSNRILLSEDINYFGKNISEIGLDDVNFTSDDSSDLCEIGDDNCIVLRSNSRINKYTYINIYSMSQYEATLSGTRIQLIVISLSLLLLGFILAYIASASNYAPFREIISVLQDADSYFDLSDNITPIDHDELAYIINSIKAHIKDKMQTEKILEERMKMLKKAQYDMLQSQINPHFLYNTLETINWMAYDLAGAENPVSTALVDLAAFFRNALSTSGYLITINDEIKYTKDYINILYLRYNELFEVKWNIDSSILSCTIIKLCLQPIIENAVYHGFKPKAEKGLLTVSGFQSEGKIIIEVADNGVGMDETFLANLNAKLSRGIYSNDGSHIGIANVNSRIKILFGDEFGIFLDSHPGKGTTVRISLPIAEGKLNSDLS